MTLLEPDKLDILSDISNALDLANNLKKAELEMRLVELIDPAQLSQIQFFWEKHGTEVLTR